MAETRDSILYAAYGELTNSAIMRMCCPNAEKIGTGIARGLRLDLTGKIPNLADDEDNIQADVVVWHIQSAEDMQKIMDRERYPEISDLGVYYIDMNKGEEKNLECLIFLSRRETDSQLKVSRGTKMNILEGYKENGFNTYAIMSAIM